MSKYYHPASPSKYSTASPPSPFPSTLPSTTSQLRRNASRSNESRAITLFAAVAGLFLSYARLIGSDCSVLPGSGNSTFTIPDATSYSFGPAPQNTDRKTASTDKGASVPRSGSYRDDKARSTSAPDTSSSPATFGSTLSRRPEVAGLNRPYHSPSNPCSEAPYHSSSDYTYSTSSGSSTILDQSRSTSGRRATQPPASPTTDRSVCNAIKLGV